jgi:hypothetical protein
VLDRVGVANRRLIGIPASAAQRPALMQKVPALVQPNLEELQALALLIAGLAVGLLLEQLMLLVRQLVDAVEHLFVLHTGPPFDRILGQPYPPGRSFLIGRPCREADAYPVRPTTIEQEDALPDTAGPPLEPQERRKIGAALFNRVWTYLDKPDRTPDDDELMVHMAHASAYHWRESGLGSPENAARSEWQISRVYAVLGRGEPALHHARRCLDICEANDIGDFDLAYAHEAMARAAFVAGDAERGERHLAAAREARAGISEDDDRELFDKDLATIPGA